MSFQIVRSSTPGQKRRRTAYRERRQVLPVATPPRAKRTRRTFKEWRAFRNANREKVGSWIAGIQARFAAWRTRSAPHCRYARVYMEKGQKVTGNPCGGKLRAWRLNPQAATVYRCEKCGREGATA